MKSFIRKILLLIVVFSLAINTYVVNAVSAMTFTVSFNEDYSSEQGHVEYQVNEGEWIIVDSSKDIVLDELVTSMKVKVVANKYYEVNFDDGPYLKDGGPGINFNAGDQQEARSILTSDGYDVTINEGLGEISLSLIGFRETTGQDSANISISIEAEGIEYWQDDIPSRITFRLPGTEDIAFGKDNLNWKDGV